MSSSSVSSLMSEWSGSVSLRVGVDTLVNLDGLLSVVSSDSGGLGCFGAWKNDVMDF
jgi:hypothetical protein